MSTKTFLLAALTAGLSWVCPVVSGVAPAEEARPPSAVVETGPVAAGGEVSLVGFNCASSRARIQAGEFSPVFLGLKDDPRGHAKELLVLRMLLGEPGALITCQRLRSELAGATPCAAETRAAIDHVAAWIREEAARPGFSDRYLSYLGEGGSVDPDFLVYTSPHAFVAAMYGNIVLEIRERTPRGVDLNGLNRDVYHFCDHLPLMERLRRRLIVNLIDRDEYVIPSHVVPEEVVSFAVRAQIMPRFGCLRPSGPVLRVYRRVPGAPHAVDLTDAHGRLIGRICAGRCEPPPPGSRSAAELPAELEPMIRALRIEGLPVTMVR